VCFGVWRQFGNMIKDKVDGATQTMDAAMPTS
jgi:hypothetical protein